MRELAFRRPEDRPPRPPVFVNGAGMVALTCGGIVFVISGSSLAAKGGWGYLVIVVPAVWLTWRGMLYGRLVIKDDGTVVVHRTVRTVRLPLADIASADIDVGVIGGFSAQREYLVLTRRDGSRLRFPELNGSPKARGDTSVRQACAALCARIGQSPSE